MRKKRSMTTIYETMRDIKAHLDEVMSLIDQKETEHISFLRQLESENERLTMMVEDLKRELLLAEKRVEDHEARERQLRQELLKYGKKNTKLWGLFL